MTSPSSTAAIVILAALSREPASGRFHRTMVIDPVSVCSQSASLRETPRTECAFPSHRDRRMRFYVECAFPHLRKRGAGSRKSAFCPRHLTEKRTLAPVPHVKAHSNRVEKYRLRLLVAPRGFARKCNLRRMRRSRRCARCLSPGTRSTNSRTGSSGSRCRSSAEGLPRRIRIGLTQPCC